MRGGRAGKGRVAAGILLSGTLAVAIAESPPVVMPDPLNLETALTFASRPHPQVQADEAELEAAEAETLAARAETGLRTRLEARLRYSDPLFKYEGWTNEDHRLGLVVSKRLYDFGRSSALEQAATLDVSSRRLLLDETRQQRRIDILQRFFDVLLADLEFARYNEEMAVVYVALDKLRDQHELGQVSDIVVLEKETEYQRVRRQRFESQNRQRLTRARLAFAMGLPGQLPANVVRPMSLPQVQRTLPPVEELQADALAGNRELQALRQALAAARERVKSARAGDYPLLDARAEANKYSRPRAGYDNWRVELNLQVPITTGGLTDAAVARERAAAFRLQAELADAEERIRQQVLELWLRLDALRIQREEMMTASEYRELYLDRSRALYELEVKTDLGDAMVRLTETERDVLKTDFEIALAWEQLDLLLGRSPAGADTPAHSAEESKP